VSASAVVTWTCDWCDAKATSYSKESPPDGWRVVDVPGRGYGDLCRPCLWAFNSAEERIQRAAHDLWLPVIWARRDESAPSATPEA
jgi:hypothetical protein